MWIIFIFILLLILYFCKESFELEDKLNDIFKKDEKEDKTPVEKNWKRKLNELLSKNDLQMPDTTYTKYSIYKNEQPKLIKKPIKKIVYDNNNNNNDCLEQKYNLDNIIKDKKNNQLIGFDKLEYVNNYLSDIKYDKKLGYIYDIDIPIGSPPDLFK